MRALNDNIFYKYIDKLVIENSTENTLTMVDKNYTDEALFSSGEFGYIRLEGICETINSIAIANTNACFVIVSIININDEERFYTIEIKNKIENINIENIEIKNITIGFYKNKNREQNIKSGYLTAGLAVDFPPHSKKKTHTINLTHEKFFSQSGQYFSRHLPLKKYDAWTVGFDLLTNKDKNIILDFFEANNFESFILQVWRQKEIAYYSKNPLVKEDNIYKLKNNDGYKKEIVNKYEMNLGFYVCTNDKIDFKKNNNDKYQWATSLTFREVK